MVGRSISARASGRPTAPAGSWRSRRSTALQVARVLGVLLLGVGSAVALAPPASAHNSVVSTAPAADSTVTVLPTEVTLTFEEAPLPGGTAIVVRDPAGSAVTSGKTVITGDSASVALLPLTVPGRYAVTYRSASDDGHTITGAFAFTVPASLVPSPSPTATPTPSQTPTPTPSPASSSPAASPSTSPVSGSSGSSAVPWLVGAAVVVVVVAVVVAVLRRRSA